MTYNGYLPSSAFFFANQGVNVITRIDSFSGQYRFLSNFFPAKFTWRGLEWSSSECAFQAAKSLNPNDWLKAQSMTPSQAKRFGKTVTMRPDWKQIKFCIMAEICKEKFMQNPELLVALKATGSAYLEEGNTWGDRVWGVSPPGSGAGGNWLGLVLMALRSTL